MALGAYQAESTRGSVLNALAHPTVANPLAAIQAGQEAAKTQYGIRSLQAQQALGGILQQATDANGNTDYNRAAALAAQAGPAVQLGMQNLLLNNSVLRGRQLEQGGAMTSAASRAVMTVMNDPSDANINQVMDGLNRMYPGQKATWDSERQAILAIQDPDQRRTYAYQKGIGQLDAHDAMIRSPYGQTTVQDVGGAAVPVTTTQPSPYGGGNLRVGAGSAPYTMSPNIVGTQIIEWPATEADVKAGRASSLGQPVRMGGADIQRNLGQGGLLPPGAHVVTAPPGAGGAVVNSDGSPATPNNPPRLLKVPGGTTTATPPTTQNGVQQGGPAPAPPGAPAGASSSPYTGGGIGAALNPPSASGSSPASPAPMPVPPVPPQGATSTAPSVAPPPTASAGGTSAVDAAKAQAARTGQEVPIPGVPGFVAKPNGNVGPPASTGLGPRAALQGGVPVASVNALAPNVAAGSAPSALVPGDVNAILAGINRARGVPTTGTQTAATFAVGPGVQEPAEWKASADRLAADDTTAANFANTQFPAVQALAQYGRGTVTGPNADLINRVGGYIRTPLQKLGFNVGDLSDANARYDALNKWLSQIVATTPFAAGSDARLAQVLNGSANTHINQAAGEDMLKAGIVLQRMNVAANQQWHSMSSQQQAQYGGLYLNFLRGYANQVDPRAFGVDMYNDKQLADLRTALKSGGEVAAKRFNDSKALADGLSAQPALP